MTIASDISRVDLVGDGANDTFAFTFEIYAKTDILVYVGGILKTVDIHYTVPIAGIQNPDGGNVVFTAGNKPGDGVLVAIILNLPLTQLIDYIEADKFPAETHERGLDRLVKIVQQLKEGLSRSPSVAISSLLSNLTIPEAASRAIGWNTDATEFTTFPTTPINRANIDSLDIDYSGSLATMVTSIGANKRSVLVDTAGSLTANLEIPDNIHLIWLNGCVWNGAYNLTINGPFEAGLSQCFGSSITVTFGGGAVEKVYPQWRGANNNETTNEDETAIEWAIDAAPTGGTVFFPSGSQYYKTADAITINKALTLEGEGEATEIRQVTSNKGAFIVTASNVKIKNLKLYGPQCATLQSSEVGIRAYGADKDNYISGLKIIDCIIANWGYAGVCTEFVEKFNISENHVYDTNYTGIQLCSTQDGTTSRNIVHDIDNGNANAGSYGIQVTKGENTEANKPVCKRINVKDNEVYNVKYWEAFDIHGGDQINFNNNIVKDCARGIVFGPYASVTYGYMAPKRCTIINNTIYVNHGAGEVITLANAIYGTVLCGCNAGNGLAEDNIVEGNSISGYQKGIYIYCDRNTMIANNPISNIGDIGIESRGESVNINICNNNIRDIDAGGTAGIWMRRADDVNYPNVPSGLVQGNSIEAGALPGIMSGDDLSVSGLEFINNRIVTTGVPYYDANGLSHFPTIRPYKMLIEAWDPGSIAAGGNETHDIAVTGIDGYITGSVTADRSLGGLTASVSVAANTVTIRLDNHTSGAINLTSAAWMVRLFKLV